MPSFPRNRPRRLALVCAAIPFVCIPTIQWLAFATYGSAAGLWLVPLFWLAFLVAIPFFLMALVLLPFPSFRARSRTRMLCTASYALAFLISVELGEGLRRRAFSHLADRSAPLVAAIHAFERTYKRPPASLEELVHELLPALPTTGMRAYPTFEYRVDSTEQGGEAWSLEVDTSSPFAALDGLAYAPIQNYPDGDYENWVERFGDWVYVRE